MEHTEAVAYLKTLQFIASADNSLDDGELKCFNLAGIDAGLCPGEIAEIQNDVLTQQEKIEDIVKGIVDEKVKVSLVKELLSLCYIDGEYSVAEQNGMVEICGLLGIDGNNLSKLEAEIDKYSKRHKTGSPWRKSTLSPFLLENMAKAFEAGKNGTKLVGQRIAEGSSTVAHSVALGIGTVGAKISFSIESAKKAKEENKQLRERLKTDNLSEAVKQKVILQLNSKIKAMTSQLREEKQNNERNEELIRLLQAQIDDLTETMEVAQNVKTA